MKFRVNHPTYFPAYFKTKKEAIAYSEKIENAYIEKKIGREWFRV